MPLTWDIGECVDWESLKTDDEWPITWAVIMLMPVIGMSKITEANAAEVYARFRFTDKMNGGGPLTEWNRTGCDQCAKLGHHNLSISPQMIQKRIGLRCNVSPETYATFQRRMVKWERPEAEREYREATKVAQPA